VQTSHKKSPVFSFTSWAEKQDSCTTMAHEVHRQKGASPSDSTKKQTSHMVLSVTWAHRPDRNRGVGACFLGPTFFFFLGRCCSTGGGCCMGTLAGGRNPPVDLHATFFTSLSFFFGGADMVVCSPKGTVFFISRFGRICEDDDEDDNCSISASSRLDTLLTSESCCSSFNVKGTGGNLPFSFFS
jgi:hypothetical protein